MSGQGIHVSGNGASVSRTSAAQNACQPLGANEPTATAQGGVEAGKSSKNSRVAASPHRKRRDRQTEEHVDECLYSDDTKDHSKPIVQGSQTQGYPNGSKRFDWVKTLRIAGVQETQGSADGAQGKASSPHQECDVIECFARSSVSKSVQTAASTDGCCNDAKTFQVLENRSKTGRPETVTRHTPLHQVKPGRAQLGDLQVSESVGEGGVNDSRASSFHMTATGDSESRLKRRPDCSSIENRPGKSGKRMLSTEEMGGLDSRINYHLLKAGLRRTPSLRNALRVKKKTFGSRSPRKDGGKRLRTRTLLDLNFMAYSTKVAPRVEKLCPPCQERVDVPWQREVADCEAEYETFVETTDVGGFEEETSNVSREVATSVGEESQKRSSSIASRISTPDVKAKLSEAPVLSLMKTPQAPRKTFIRCIDLVVATKKKSQLSKLNGRKTSGVRYSYRRVDCSKSPLMGSYAPEEDCLVEPQVDEDVPENTKEESFPKPTTNEITEPDPSSTLTRMEIQDSVLHSNPAMKEYSELMSKAEEELTGLSSDVESTSVVAQVSNLATVLSRVIPKQMESMDAAQLRARWAELIDALEKERLGLPKIKTSSRRMGTGSPRDSGGVKRIAEQIKSAHQPEQGASSQKEKDLMAPEDISMSRARPLWRKVERKQEVVF